MANWELTITNSSGKGFKFKSLNRISPKVSQNNFNIGIPGLEASSNISFNLTGQERSYEVGFRLKDYEEDLAIGHNETITTLIEQFEYLDNQVITAKIDEIYTFKLFSQELNRNIVDIKCSISDFSIDFESDKVTIVNGSLSVQEGTNPFQLIQNL